MAPVPNSKDKDVRNALPLNTHVSSVMPRSPSTTQSAAQFSLPIYNHYSLKSQLEKIQVKVWPPLEKNDHADMSSSPLRSVPPHKITKIFNARLLRGHEIVTNDYLWIQNGKIIDPVSRFYGQTSHEADEVIDAKGALVVPGFIDVQINGAFGIDFTTDAEGDEETLVSNLHRVSRGLLKYGCTAYCPTVVSSEPDIYHKVLPHLCPRAGSPLAGSEILGAHIEGPFISEGKKGAHNPETFQKAISGIADFERVYGPELDNIRIITVAPELEGVVSCVSDLVDKGVTVSIGHSEAGIADAENAVASGATFITHLFNAMPAFHHRDPGIVGLLGATQLPIPTNQLKHPSPSASSPSQDHPDPRPFYGIICDGIHCHPNSVKIAYYSHPTGAVLVTDALSAMGLPAGTYSLGGRSVNVSEDLTAYIEGTNTLAGSVITIDACIRNFLAFTKCTLIEAIEAATLHPAQLLGISHKKGTLHPGADADLVFLDDDVKVQRVFVRGEEVDLTSLDD